MHIDRRIGILGLLGTAALAVAMMAAPLLFTELPRWLLLILFYGGLLLAVSLIGFAIIIGIRDESSEPTAGHGRRMIALACMIFFGLAFLVSAAWYFWPFDAHTPDSAAVAQLSALGWGVQPDEHGTRFEVSSKPLPPMQQSAAFLSKLGVPFSIQLQSLPSLDGLHYLSGIKELTRLGISAGTFTDIHELRNFVHLEELSISQTPIDGRSAVDLVPLTNLSNLRKLNLYATKGMSTAPLSNLIELRDLNLRDTWVSDLSGLSRLSDLEVLDVTDIRTGDLSPLSHDEKLELGIGSAQIPGLLALSQLPFLKKLRIISQNKIEFNPVSSLTHLEYLWVWAGMAGVDLSPLRRLVKLQEFALSSFSIGGALAPVDNVSALADLTELRTVTFGHLQLTNLSFVQDWHDLNELNLSEIPISSLEPLRGLRKLKKISINALPVVDISPLLDLPNLAELRLMRTPARADVISTLERRGVKVEIN